MNVQYTSWKTRVHYLGYYRDGTLNMHSDPRHAWAAASRSHDFAGPNMSASGRNLSSPVHHHHGGQSGCSGHDARATTLRTRRSGHEAQDTTGRSAGCQLRTAWRTGVPRRSLAGERSRYALDQPGPVSIAEVYEPRSRPGYANRHVEARNTVPHFVTVRAK